MQDDYGRIVEMARGESWEFALAYLARIARANEQTATIVLRPLGGTEQRVAVRRDPTNPDCWIRA